MNGGDVLLSKCNATNVNQKWVVNDITGQIHHATHLGFCLSASDEVDALVYLLWCDKKDTNQQWNLKLDYFEAKKLIRGALNKIALDFGLHRGTVQRVWKRANVDLDNTLRPCSDISSRKKNSGRRTTFRSITLNNLLTLQGCMRETICAQGSNAYKIPHIGKAKLMARGMLPEVLVVDRDVVELGFQQLDEYDVSAKFEELAVEVSEAMEMCDFSSQLEKLIVNDELEEDPGVELGDLLDLTHLF
ncbi:hypothetical protein B5M09_013261 [Aphanomyces astaci]|uniref:Ricin B lectin domain-containing protein n=1 Tax=Aphanomyces astaci TaxID=112090 RepID=A0A3R7YE16_APHAT|nr:hypothetical protein B5M09_013261 [Aphanomyces astaci]